MIDRILGRINVVLNHDAASSEALRQLDGCLLGVEIDPMPGKPIVVRLGYPLQLAADHAPSPLPRMVWLKGSPLNLLAALKGERQALTIDGDSALLDELEHLWSRLDIEWSQLLAETVGVETASVLSNTVSGTLSWLNHVAARFRSDALTYLQDEQATLPHPNEFQQFAEEALALRHRTDEVEARLTAMEAMTVVKVTNA